MVSGLSCFTFDTYTPWAAGVNKPELFSTGSKIHRKPPVDLVAKKGIVCMKPNGDNLQLELTKDIISIIYSPCSVTLSWIYEKRHSDLTTLINTQLPHGVSKNDLTP